MQTVRLPRGVWQFDPQQMLGVPGGFGTVFAGTHQTQGDIAVKKLHIDVSAAAHREMRIADDLAQRTLKNVVPVFDAGQDADSSSYFVVMPRAQGSLRSTIDQNGPLDPRDASLILNQIISGLIEVSDIVHRDMKPENVLNLNGSWCVSDFGIARFVEEATSLNTLKGCLTPIYAAPEQWNLEHATNASDVYAVGCIAFELLSGKPPFPDDGKISLKQKHCLTAPPELPHSVNAQLRSLVSMMLRKSPGARPSLMRIKQQLSALLADNTPVAGAECLNALGEASVAVAKREAEREAATQRAYSEHERRRQLRMEAESILIKIFEDLSEVIRASAPNVAIGKSGVSVSIRLGEGILSMNCSGKDFPTSMFTKSMWDVVAGGKIVVSQSEPRYVWSSSLWYAKLPKTHDYRWYEVAYFTNPMTLKRQQFEPFAVDGSDAADDAAAPGVSLIQIAFGPEPIDDEHSESFRDRWIDLFAKACKGELKYPRQMPIRNDK